jgi:PAS domain S-box-containing protein
MDALLNPEDVIQKALDVLGSGDAELFAILDDLTAPLYVTDTDGLITYFNPACIDFAGRTPVVRSDRWCVTWKLYTVDGEFMPHDRCPMAIAIREKRQIRGLKAVAERPDGSKLTFMPYPTPVLKDGAVVGALNILIDITDASQAADLWAQVDRARRLARANSDKAIAETLERLAEEYESKAIAFGGPRAPQSRLN